ncbi:MAG: hypothetical protein AUH11_05580 [Acidobacteria bacterium 13_2_20CM_57_17]|nr:MAG: hypothetical protein AUH11_05580 [Acidobacteria bacterium 13_2_20CM_57_17]OLB96288.1 MAG: hypothetical protein AUI02_02525 [Acidobacteria bacterium 13_2_20CM_2_57_12]
MLLGTYFIAASSASRTSPRVIRVFVALAVNQHQGIIPVPSAVGNGQDPQRNLYWGAAYGVKTYFKASEDWKLVWSGGGSKNAILQRCVFKSSKNDVYLVADAYEGSQIKMAVTDFLSAAAGIAMENVSLKIHSEEVSFAAAGDADVIVYVGHDAFMDFQIPPIAGTRGDKSRRTIILACASRPYFGPYIRQTGAEPLLWTTGLMAPEAYTLKAALDGWIAREDDEAIQRRAAQAYDKYQKCGARAAMKLFATNR